MGGARPAPPRRGPGSRRGREPVAADGFTLLELVAALSILAIVAVGFAATVSLGFRTVALARQRVAASEIASARLEHLRSVPFAAVALSSAPMHSTVPGNPDEFVSLDGVSYDVTGEGDTEPLIVDAGGGAVLHLEDPVVIGNNQYEIYQYVTWFDAPTIPGTENLRRVTVVVAYKAPAVNGVSRIVRASTLFADEDVVLEAPTTTTTIPGATTTSTSTTTTTVPSTSCPGDDDWPSGWFSLSGGAGAEVGYTAGTNVAVHQTFWDPCTPIVARYSNDGTTYGADVVYDPLNQAISWSLSDGDGVKTVSGKVRDGVGNERTLSGQSIVLDTLPPTVPGTLSRTVSCSGRDRTVSLSWGTASDLYLRGYRVYVSTDGTTWSQLTTASGSTAVDSHKKNLDSVRYRVVAYDKAGNESDPTNVVSLAKNECS